LRVLTRRRHRVNPLPYGELAGGYAYKGNETVNPIVLKLLEHQRKPPQSSLSDGISVDNPQQIGEMSSSLFTFVFVDICRSKASQY